MDEQQRENWQRELAKCDGCGACRRFCPVFKALDDECFVARGKLHIIKHYLQGDLSLTDELITLLEQCVSCGGCQAKCPSGVDTSGLFREMRASIVAEKGVPFKKNALVRVIAGGVFKPDLLLSKRFQGLVLKKAPDGHGQVARTPLAAAGLNLRRIIPELPQKNLSRLVGDEAKAANPRHKVAFFTGCLLNYVYPQVGQDLISVLNHHHYDVLIPKMQRCCGMQLLMTGETDSARELIRKNLTVFQSVDVEAIITGCAACGFAWKTGFGQILGVQDAQYELTQKLGAKTFDISEFLAKIGLDTASMMPVDVRVTYHDSCLLNYGQQISRQPRELIEAIPGVTLLEMAEPDACCGSGGFFNLKYGQLSRQINQHKNCLIDGSGAQTVLTGCPACLMHLSDGLARDKMDIKVHHVAELLAESYGLKRGRRQWH